MRPVFAAFVVASTLCMLASNAGAVEHGRSTDVSVTSLAALQVASPSDQVPLRVLTDSEQRARDREQLLGLEERVNRQQREYQATQQAVAAMQARLREAEQGRRTDPAIYGLSTLVVLLLGTIAFLLWRLAHVERKRNRLEERRGLAGVPAPEAVAPLRTAPLAVTPPLDEVTMTSMRVLDEPQSSAIDPDAPTIAPGMRERHDLSVDELIDLEQQADFYIALGQEDAAIDLLMGHVRSSGGASPMPYLKLLAIYRGRSDGDAYERIRERFNRRFNARAPSWEEYGQQKRNLEDYQSVHERVGAAWKNPAEAVDLVQALLYRRDASPETFELPAYEELLFLHAVARDVLEHMTNPDGVDLLLPIGVELEEPAILHYELTRPPEAWMSQVDLDIEVTPAPVPPLKR
jgi:hypothetical protein